MNQSITLTTMEAAVIRLARFEADRRVSLANEAERRGVRIIRLAGTERHIAVEPQSPIGYVVTVDECSCKRFRIWGCCDHRALLQSELGYGANPEEIGWPGEKAFVNATDLDVPAGSPSALAAD